MTPPLTGAASRYLDDVAAHLGTLPAAERRAALADLRDLLTEGVNPDDLGPAEDYATALGARRDQEPSETLGRVLGMPVDVRGTTDPHVRSRVFDPSDPRMVVPRVLGAGWRLNYGAVAVRLGLLRPDDYDDEVLAHIPADVARLTRAMPWIVAAKTAVWATVAWRTGREVPSNWDLSGRVSGWSDRRVVLPALVAIAAGAAVWGSRATAPDDRLVRQALATSAGSTTTTIALLTAWTAGRPDEPHPAVAAAVLAPLATTAAMLICPVRAGLRALPPASATPANPAASATPATPSSPQDRS